MKVGQISLNGYHTDNLSQVYASSGVKLVQGLIAIEKSSSLLMRRWVALSCSPNGAQIGG